MIYCITEYFLLFRFASLAARVLINDEIPVYLFSTLCPTPYIVSIFFENKIKKNIFNSILLLVFKNQELHVALAYILGSVLALCFQQFYTPLFCFSPTLFSTTRLSVE